MAAYISEFDIIGGPGHEFVEVEADAGANMSGYSLYVYNSDGTVAFGPYSLGTVQNTINNNDVYVIDDSSAWPDIGWEHAIALIDDGGNVVQFLSFNGNTVTATNGPADGANSTDLGRHGFNDSMESTDDGATFSRQSTSNPGTVACYAPAR